MTPILLVGALSLTLLAIDFITARTALSSNQSTAMHNHLAAQTKINLRKDAFAVLHRTFQSNEEIMRGKRVEYLTNGDYARGFWAVAPTLLPFWLFIVLALRRSRQPLYMQLLGVLAGGSPLLMHWFGWDIFRWYALSVTTSFLMVYTAAMKTAPPHRTPTAGRMMSGVGMVQAAAFAALIALSMRAEMPLFDGYQIKRFPYTAHQNHLKQIMHGNRALISPPKR